MKPGLHRKAALLLVLALLAGGVWLYAQYARVRHFTVSVQNHSHITMVSARLVGACCDIRLGDIPAGRTQSATFSIGNDGELVMYYRQHGRKRQVRVSGYLGINQGGSLRVVIGPNGAVDVN